MNKQRSLLGMAVGVVLLALLLWGIGPGVDTASAVDGMQQGERSVIKRGDLVVMVADTETAVQQALDTGTTFDSYVLSQHVWTEGDGFHYATITFGVPVTEFENLLAALKDLGTVQNETVTGQDVADERVDLASRFSNLEETQTRLRDFLEMATNVTETLKVHQELLQNEREIGQVQGRMNFLTERADAATITLNLTPFVPTPTPTPTATPTPLPTAKAWRPGDTAQLAAVALRDTAQNTADSVIFRTITCGPWLLLVLALAAYPAWRLYRRRRPPR